MILFPRLEVATRPLVISLACLAAGVAIGLFLRNAESARREAVYERQRLGELSEQERQLEALHTELGLTRSRLKDQGTLERRYEAQLARKDADFEAFRTSHHLRVQSLSGSLFVLQQQLRKGTTRVQEGEPSSRSGAGAPPGRAAISYEYVDSDGRVRLTDPDIWVQGNERLELTQRFRVNGTVLRQEDGSLMTQRVELLEVSSSDKGAGRELARAKLEDATFTYANAPRDAPPPPPSSKGRSWLLTVGASPGSELRLRFGSAVRLLRLGRVGFAAGASSDFKSLEGTGADAFLTYTPSVGGRELNLAVGGGVYLPLEGRSRVLPNLTLSFILD